MSLRLGTLWLFMGASGMVAPAYPGAVAATFPTPATGTPSASMESAPIEEVIDSSDGGYRFDAYVVHWHGARVLISDLLGVCHLNVGDRIRFMVTRSDVGERHVLGFMSMERPETQPSAASGQPPSFAGESATATVDEVLSVTDGDYRFTAYIVEWHGQRIAIPDLTGGQSMLAGAPIRFMATRLSVMGHQVLQFMDVPAGVNFGAASLPATANVTHDVGLIEEVLKGSFSGDSYAAYIVSWHGSQVALDPGKSSPLQQAGETALLRVRRVDPPFGSGAGKLVFTPDTAEDSAPAADVVASAVGSMVEGVVERILQAQVEGYHYRAYVVRWNGSRVVVDDVLGTTKYQAGDRISFVMAHGATGAERQVGFLLLDPKATLAPKTDTTSH
jgi:hypothetical protein